MAIGIGGAGSRLAAKLDPEATLVNVSQTELDKVDGGSARILASVHSLHGQLRGSRKNRDIGHDAYQSVRRQLQELIRGNKVFCSSGGGTGNGITTGILEDIASVNEIPTQDKTFFGIVLPYPDLEPTEFVDNTIQFLSDPLSKAIAIGNTGNVVLFSNKVKFEAELSEENYNEMLVESLKVFLAIPDKNDDLKLLDGHIDHEDFALYLSKPYFNHFCYFDYDPDEDFGKQLEANYNKFLLLPDAPIEAMFLLEIPKGGDPTCFYEILRYFAKSDVAPVYSVVENPEIDEPFITVSLLYSRMPDELVDDFCAISQRHAHAKVRKTMEQFRELQKLDVNMEKEAMKVAKENGNVQSDILDALRRIGKL